MPRKPKEPPIPPPPILHHWFDGPQCPNQVGTECRCSWWVRHEDDLILAALALFVVSGAAFIIITTRG